MPPELDSVCVIQEAGFHNIAFLVLLFGEAAIARTSTVFVATLGYHWHKAIAVAESPRGSLSAYVLVPASRNQGLNGLELIVCEGIPNHAIVL